MDYSHMTIEWANVRGITAKGSEIKTSGSVDGDPASQNETQDIARIPDP